MSRHRLIVRLPELSDPRFGGAGAVLDTVDDLANLGGAGGTGISREMLDLLNSLLTPHGLSTSRFVLGSVVSPAGLRSREAEANIRTPARATRPELHSLTQYWVVDTRMLSETARRDVQLLLQGLPIVELCLVEPDLSEPTVTHLDGYYKNQRYLDPGPVGIGVEAVWDAGYAGEFTRLVDVERGWLYTHVDLPPLPGDQPLNGHVLGTKVDHGTSVLGVIAALDGPAGEPGVVGIAPRIATLHTSSRYVDNPNGADDQWDVAGAMEAAKGKLEAGDVILLEVEQVCVLGDGGPVRRLPLELFPPYWELIRLAVDEGYTVVEPAGNGGREGMNSAPNAKLGGLDLDRAATDPDVTDWFGGPLKELDRTISDEDSGAIMVGAGWPSITTEEAATPNSAIEQSDGNADEAWGSNYGNRVDCFAWGNSVWTTARDHSVAGSTTVPPVNEHYTDSFNGTSAASAIIAGAAVLVQDMCRHFYGGPVECEKLRDLLKNPETGTPYTGVRAIGVMPDLGPVLKNINCKDLESVIARFRCRLRRFKRMVRIWLKRLLDWF